MTGDIGRAGWRVRVPFGGCGCCLAGSFNGDWNGGGFFVAIAGAGFPGDPGCVHDGAAEQEDDEGLRTHFGIAKMIDGWQFDVICSR